MSTEKADTNRGEVTGKVISKRKRPGNQSRPLCSTQKLHDSFDKHIFLFTVKLQVFWAQPKSRGYLQTGSNMQVWQRYQKLHQVVRLHMTDVEGVKSKCSASEGRRNDSVCVAPSNSIYRQFEKEFNRWQGVSVVEGSRGTRKPVRHTGTALICSIQDEKRERYPGGRNFQTFLMVHQDAAQWWGEEGHCITAVFVTGTKDFFFPE